VRVLVLGGTGWLGWHVASAALARGADVTCLARGSSGAPPAGVTFVAADRDRPGAYHAVAGRAWDVVVDVARQPGHVRRAVAALAGPDHDLGCYVLVSSGSVYADHRTRDLDESAELLPALAADEMASPDDYGAAKVACERAVRDGAAARAILARAGLIAGPGDVSDRTGYWPWRFAHPAGADGAVLVADAPDEVAAVVDVRDLAGWLVDAGAGGRSGAFDVTGEPMPTVEHLQVAREVAGHTGPVVAAGAGWLHAHGVGAWSGPRSLPLWLGDPDWAGFTSRRSRRARAAGLTTRPLADTLADTLAWERTRPAGRNRDAGLSDADERALLAELRGAGPAS
jgi:nucleoside-diphosphate-sugar epimerase